METTDTKTTETASDFTDNGYKRPRSGRFFGGIIILAVGVLLLLRQLGTVALPDWLFTWPMILIAIGLYSGARHGSRGRGWIILLLIGGLFLTQEFYPKMNLWQYIWPIIIIAAGLLMIFRPKRHWDWHNHAYWEGKGRRWSSKYYQDKDCETPPSAGHSEDDYVDSVSVFGGVQKVIVSKNFKGGDVVNIFGGSEINLSQADMKGKVILDVVQIFGGSKIIVPADWTIQSKMVSIFGGIEDKRHPAMLKPNPDKILVVEGVSIFAGIEIMSY